MSAETVTSRAVATSSIKRIFDASEFWLPNLVI
jgi:hypothetical protein